MRFLTNQTITYSASTYGAQYLFALLDFMRQAPPNGPGWTISISCNGSVASAGDNIATYSDLTNYVSPTSRSYFVLRQPDGNRELLWYRTRTSIGYWGLYYSKTGAFVIDGTTPLWTIPAATDGVQVHGDVAILAAVNHTLRIGADDASPYGWWQHGHLAGDFTDGVSGYAMIPITDVVQPGETDPMVIYSALSAGNFTRTSGLWEDSTSSTSAACRAWVTGPDPDQFNTVPALAYYSGGGVVFPHGCEVDANGNDLTVPMMFGRRSDMGVSRGLKGISSFMRWNGVARSPGETFDNKARISLGEVNAPWDGVTNPVP